MLDETTLAGVHNILPNPKTVTITDLAGSTTTGITGTHRRPWNRTDYAVAGSLGTETDRVAFVIPKASLTSIEPVNGWYITDSDGSWTILAVNRELEGTMRRFTCVKRIS